MFIVGFSIFLAIALNPAVSRISRLFPGRNRAPATAIAYILIVTIIGSIIVVAIPPIVSQVADFIQTASVSLGYVISDLSYFSASVEQYGIQEILDSVLASLQQSSAHFAQNIGSTVVSGASSIIAGATATILVIVITFLMLIQGPSMLDNFWDKLGTDDKRAVRARAISRKMAKVISNFVNNQLLIALIDGSFTAIAIFVFSFVFGVPIGLVIPLALIAALLSPIPMFGTIIAGAISAIMVSFSSIPAAIIFVVYFTVYQQTQNNIIFPAIQSRTAQMPVLTVLVSVTIGVYMFGLIGAIMAIPFAGCVKVLVDEFVTPKKPKKPTPEPAAKAPVKAS
ncbi:AI-2E family transporter [Candidatus Saccharibacteria bacterium]|nr:AI-2E family transporter [Candidatus Saccharibacteria bacterium]